MSGDHNQFQKNKSYLDQKPRMKGLRWHVKPDGDDLLVCFDYAVKPEDEYVRFVRAEQQSDFECPRCGHCCTDDYERGFVDGMQRQMQSSVDKALNEKREPLFWSVSTGWVYADDMNQEHVDGMAEQEQEPWAWANTLDFDDDDIEIIPARAKGKLGTSNCDIPLFTALPKREWFGLTGDEARKFYEKYTDREELIHAIDKFLEEKNHGH